MSQPKPEPRFPHGSTPRNLRHAALGALIALATLLSPFGSLAAAPKAGDTFPDLAGASLEGTLPELRNRVVLVDFWASWCGPCKKSFPVMAELHRKYQPRGLEIIAISVDEKKAAMDAFLKKSQPPFTVVRDAQGHLAEIAGLETMPTSYLVGPDGRILAVHSGFEGETTRKKYVDEIESALKAAGK